ncbi:hypothetical protein [Niveispirillum sp. KHB5.9]|uniref:hypothetical protein n=1 Tax=Niveispirillum sp. KHB5.9 TaxID=3400269 RepID=UPI003A845E5A
MRAIGLAMALLVALPAMAAPEHCFTPSEHGGVRVMVYIGDRKCVEFDEPREFTGIWINAFESSRFNEGATSLAEAGERKPLVWLSLDDQSIRPAGFRVKLGHAYRLTMIARSAKDMNRQPLEGYGHFGMWPGLVLVERITAWEDLGPAAENAPGH